MVSTSTSGSASGRVADAVLISRIIGVLAIPTRPPATDHEVKRASRSSRPSRSRSQAWPFQRGRLVALDLVHDVQQRLPRIETADVLSEEVRGRGPMIGP